ncbi:hypothetical protein N9955_00535 [bacterium]|nr:hypothetical protein [bacterium]
MKLLSTNAKLEKSVEGYLILGLQLAPHKQAGVGNVCPNASAGCIEACLFSAGMGIFPNVMEGRKNKTRLFFEDKKEFMRLIFKEIKAAKKKADKLGLKLAIRLNTISDIAWEKVKHEGQNAFDAFSDVTFYDYTKSPQRMAAFVAGEMPKNYHLTFSRSEEKQNQKFALSFLKSAGNVAAVFRGKLPKTWNGFKVVDGDKSDARFLDPRGVVVGLVEKGLAKKDETGFVIEPV